MHSRLQRIAHANTERAKVKAARVAELLRRSAQNPDSHERLMAEAKHLAKKVVYHMHQAMIVGGFIEDIEVQRRQAISYDGRRTRYRRDPHRLC